MSIITINSEPTVKKTPNRVQTNWKNMSTVGKIATVAGTIVLIGAAVAALIWGSHLLALSHLSTEASALVLNATVGVLGLVGLGAPACTLLKKSKPIVEPTTPSIFSKIWGKTQAAHTHAKALVATSVERLEAWRAR